MKGLVSTGGARAPLRAHVLVVDDDPKSRELMRQQLAGAGYRVSTAEDAVEAGHRVAERAPDLIVADARMPFMSGVEFIAALRADETIPDIPVVFLTHLDNIPQLTGRTFGFPLLSKPLVADELVATVAALLRARG